MFLIILLFCSFAYGTSVTSVTLSQVNALAFNCTLTTNIVTSLYAKYYPIAGEYFGDDSQKRSLATKLGTSHFIFFGNMYANSTYLFKVYEKSTKSLLYTGSFNTTAIPSPIRDTVFTVYGNPDPSQLYLFNVPDFSGLGNNYIYKANYKGKIVWYMREPTHYPSGFGLAEDSNSLLYVNAVNRLSAYTPWGVEVKSATTDNCPDFHHECSLEKNERYIWTLNIHLLNDGIHPGVQADETFVRWDLDANTMQVMANVSNYISTNVRTGLSDLQFFGYIPCKDTSVTELKDWLHGNSLMRSKHPKKYMVYSMRSLSAVAIFDKDLQQLLYTVGGPNSDFTFPNPSDRFTTQHSASILDSGTQVLKLLVFDNGVESAVPYNRALLLKLDTVTMEASKIWEYRLSSNPNCLGNFTGSVFEAEDGNGYIVNFPTCTWNFAVPNTAHIVNLNGDGIEQSRLEQYKPYIFFNYRAYYSKSVNGEELV